jgi:DNA repair exonuclease SbcCD ATPase subunit
LKHELADLNAKKEEWEGNKENIENLERTMSERDAIKQQIVNFKSELKECENKKLDYYRVNGSLEQKLETIKETKQEYLKLRREYSAHDLFLRCMHSNGISYEIIKKQIPIINQEVSRILSNIVDFKIFFEDDGNKMNIFIQHPGETTFEARPLEMGSGAEKTIAAMAIRLALLSVSNLPKGDIFILDEPGVALDEENMEGFIRLLELIKTYFKTVLLISHLDSLKDCVDTQLTIENNDGYAHVKH